jgi:hypothetical protein
MVFRAVRARKGSKPMTRRLTLLAGVAALAVSLMPAQAVGPTGVACAISGTAKLSPGVTTKATPTNYTFTGKLTPCKSTDAKIKSGTVTASGSGKLSCVNGSSKGTATVAWNNGQTSTVAFTTTDAGSLVVVQGKVTSGEFAGTKVTQGVEGVLSFITTQATACTKTGLSTLQFKGEVGAGSFA